MCDFLCQRKEMGVGYQALFGKRSMMEQHFARGVMGQQHYGPDPISSFDEQGTILFYDQVLPRPYSPV